MKPKPGPHKPYDEDEVGEVVQTNYEFLETLFDARKGAKLRRQLWGQANEARLRAFLRTKGIVVPAGVRIMLVDIENARTKVQPPAIDPKKDSFYVLVLPPMPRRKTKDPTKKDYKEMQAWKSAWYHASNDGYGM